MGPLPSEEPEVTAQAGLQRLAAVSAAGTFPVTLRGNMNQPLFGSISWEAAGPGNLWFEHQFRDQMKWLLAVECVARATDNVLLSQVTHVELAFQASFP